MTQTNYDAIVIGSGQAAGPLATALAKAGRRTALVEREHVGGTCINEGCTPTKTMVASARIAHLVRRAGEYGVQTGPISIDLAQVRERKRAIVTSFRGGSQRRLSHADGLDLIFGEAQFSGPNSIAVALHDGTTTTLHAKQIMINVGARPAVPTLEGINDVPTLDSTTIMELAEVPKHLLVLGGGYIGLEFSQMFRRFGSAVTIVQRANQLLGREDRDVAEAVATIMRDEGITVLLDTAAVRVAPHAQGIALTVRTPEGEQTLHGSHLLLAAGRTPNTDRLNLAAAGIATDKHGFIQVNERLETNIPGVYALGDVKGGPAFTHISYDDFRILRTNLIGGGSATITDRLVPYTVFIDPQLGRVGLTEQAARTAGHNIRIASMPMTHVARALEVDETRGFMKVIVDADSQQVLGCAILGLEGGELMSLLQIAMMGKLPYPVLRDAIFAHPTLAEAFNNLFATLD